MREDRFVKRLDAVGAFLRVIAWPLVVTVALFYFAPALKKKILDSQSIKIGAVGMSAELAVANLTAAAQVKKDSLSDSSTVVSPGTIAAVVTELSSPEAQAAIGKTRILWVDDNPANNEYELNTLRALSFVVDVSTSTAEALSRLSASDYNLVISDIRREPEQRAGFEMLSAMREKGKNIPVIFYTGSATLEQQEEARTLGPWV